MRELKYILTSFLTIVFTCSESFSQLTISNGNNVLEISGSVSSFYNYRVLKPGEFDRKKDRFKLRDAQIQLEGRIGNDIEYELQADLADMASGTSGVDPANPGLMDAHFMYKGLKFVNITAGYGKLHYSRSSMTSFIYSPYWQRSEFTRGELFSRRDIGVTLSKSYSKQRINVYAGAYTGLGELSIQGNNDPSGQPEYVGRVDFAYPSRYRYQDIDIRHVPIPMFAIGFNGRYANKTLSNGSLFPAFAVGDYGWRVINGKKYTYGMDVSFQYKGLSAQFEIHQLKAMPKDSTSFLYQGYNLSQTNGYILAGGYQAQLNYFSKKLKTIVSARYEDFNLNDLAQGTNQRLSFAVAYQIDGFKSMIKLQYFNILKEESSVAPLTWNEQFRIGWQLLFK